MTPDTDTDADADAFRARSLALLEPCFVENIPYHVMWRHFTPIEDLSDLQVTDEIRQIREII